MRVREDDDARRRVVLRVVQLPVDNSAAGGDAVEGVGARLLFLQLSGPDFHPIENAFAKLVSVHGSG